MQAWGGLALRYDARPAVVTHVLTRTSVSTHQQRRQWHLPPADCPPTFKQQLPSPNLGSTPVSPPAHGTHWTEALLGLHPQRVRPGTPYCSASRAVFIYA